MKQPTNSQYRQACHHGIQRIRVWNVFPISDPPYQTSHLRPPISGPQSQTPHLRPPISDPPSQAPHLRPPISGPPFQTPYLRPPSQTPISGSLQIPLLLLSCETTISGPKTPHFSCETTISGPDNVRLYTYTCLSRVQYQAPTMSDPTLFVRDYNIKP